MGNPNDQAFLQAVILQPGGTLVVYDPLVIDAGTEPAAPPVNYTPPDGSVVGIFGGGNGGQNLLTGPGAGSCIQGFVYQVFFCNTHTLLTAIATSGIKAPPIGTDLHGNPCPTSRSFKIVDQDQSDNVQTRYLLTADGRTAQDNAENVASLPGAEVIKNGSDNTLLTRFVLPAIGCTPWLLPDAATGTLQPTQAANEIQAAIYQDAPQALIPAGDPMVGPANLLLLNEYRSSVYQPTVSVLGQANTVAYCAHMQNTAPAFFSEYASLLSASSSPDSGTNLHDFLVARFQASVQQLGCHNH